MLARLVAGFSIPPQAATTFLLHASYSNALLLAPLLRSAAILQFIDPRLRPTVEYTFTLKYQLPDDNSVDDVVERLGGTGCNDVLVGIGRAGYLSLDLTRDATSAKAALVSALSDVKRAVPSAKLIETTLAPQS